MNEVISAFSLLRSWPYCSFGETLAVGKGQKYDPSSLLCDRGGEDRADERAQ